MNKKIEQLYYSLPIGLQNIAVSLMGYKLYKERYNAAGIHMLEKISASQHYSPAQVLQLQDEAFCKIATHAITHTKFYKNWAAEKGINTADIKGLKDIALFPVIPKELIRKSPLDFKSSAPHLIKSQFELGTSGTTGTPLRIFSDKYSRSAHYAFFSRLRSQHGVTSDSKRATLFGRIIMGADVHKPPFWRYDFFQKNLLMSSYHLNDANLPHYYKQLCNYAPDEIFAYPSSIFAIAKYIVDNKLQPISLKLVMTTAEKLLPQQAEIIQKAFNAPLVNQYGCTEMAFFCSGVHPNNMVFHPEHGYAEVLTPEGAVSDIGTGELLATGFINESMPLIRYAVGDTIALGERNESGWQTLGNVSGRTDDVIYTLNGSPIGRLDPIFKGGSGIMAAQIVQNPEADILLKLVPAPDFTQACADDLVYELRKRVGAEHPIKVELVDSIEKQKNGKFRPVICHYRPQ